jgi:acyl-CoA reductase-like NAD-dependent aldehyde dehydrogenase
MRAAADILDAERDDVAALMTTEMGKTLAAARAEAAKCAQACRFYAERARGFLTDEPADADAVGAARAYVRYQPLGPVLAIMPWNFPLWQANAVRRASADGRQRRAAQARVERAAHRAVHGQPVPPGGLPGGGRSRPC